MKFRRLNAEKQEEEAEEEEEEEDEGAEQAGAGGKKEEGKDSTAVHNNNNNNNNNNALSDASFPNQAFPPLATTGSASVPSVPTPTQAVQLATPASNVVATAGGG